MHDGMDVPLQLLLIFKVKAKVKINNYENETLRYVNTLYIQWLCISIMYGVRKTSLQQKYVVHKRNNSDKMSIICIFYENLNKYAHIILIHKHFQ